MPNSCSDTSERIQYIIEKVTRSIKGNAWVIETEVEGIKRFAPFSSISAAIAVIS